MAIDDLLPLIGKATILDPGGANQYAAFPLAFTDAELGIQLVTYWNWNGSIPATHYTGGAVRQIRNGGPSNLLFQASDCPPGYAAAWIGDGFVWKLPGTSRLRMLMSRGGATTPPTLYMYADSVDAAQSWSGLTAVPDVAEFAGRSWLIFDTTPSLDGTKLYATAYGLEAGESAYSVALLETSDMITWTLKSWIQRSSADQPCDEANLIRFPGGRLLVCMRTSTAPVNGVTGYVAVSDDDADTWSTAIPAPGVAAQFAGCNWMGQRGYSVSADYALLWGRATDLSPYYVGAAYWLLSRDGAVVRGPIPFDLLHKTGNTADGDYCAPLRGFDGEVEQIITYTTAGTIGNPMLLSYPLEDREADLAAPVASPFAVVKQDLQTWWLLRRLRAALADKDRVVYPDDNELVQALIDNHPKFQAEYGTAAVFFTPEDTSDPLKTDLNLTRDEQEIWALITARELLEPEVLQAGRMAATMRGPSGSQDYREIYKALTASLDRVTASLGRLLNDDGALLQFVDLTTIAGRVNQL